MIHDTLAHASQYEVLGPRIEAALRLLRQNDLNALPLGRWEIDGQDLFAIVDEYDSKPLEKCFWEAHRKYIDVQFLVRGVEQMGHAELGGLRAPGLVAPLERLGVFARDHADELSERDLPVGEQVGCDLRAGSHQVLGDQRQ